MQLKAAEVQQDLGAIRQRGAPPDLVFAGVATDTRQSLAATLFFALRGERFDGHDFVPQALERGARGVVVALDTWERWQDLPGACFAVEDPLRALQELARASLRRWPLRVVAITGSNGKTTTKDLTAAALGSAGSVYATRGNLNNHIGVPLTVLARRGDERFLVAEIGASDFGEIDGLSRLLQPDAAVITNIGHAHLERFGSLQGVLRAKSEIFAGLRPGGLAVLSADDPFLPELRRAAASARQVTFGFAAGADYRLDSARPDGPGYQQLRLGGTSLRLARPGRGNAGNAAAAFAVACELGAAPADAAAAMEACVFTKQRSSWTRIADVWVLDDSYNANPDSMAQALEVLASHEGRRVACLGDMRELGSASAALHATLGRSVARAGVGLFLATGEEMRHAVAAAVQEGLGDAARHHPSFEALLEDLRRSLRAGDAVLVKGSRAAGMERVVEALRVGVA